MDVLISLLSTGCIEIVEVENAGDKRKCHYTPLMR